MVKMPADQAKAKVGELEKICVCSTCPTYTATCASKAGESVFCARGTSFKCITANKGCVCTTCPVSKSMGLDVPVILSFGWGEVAKVRRDAPVNVFLEVLTWRMMVTFH